MLSQAPRSAIPQQTAKQITLYGRGAYRQLLEILRSSGIISANQEPTMQQLVAILALLMDALHTKCPESSPDHSENEERCV